MTDDYGHVREELGALRASVDNLLTTWGEKDRQATEGRRELYRKFDELKDEVRDTSAKLESLARDFLKMEPAVQRFEIARHRSAGANWALRMVWSALIAGVGAIAYVLHEWAGTLISLFWPPKH